MPVTSLYTVRGALIGARSATRSDCLHDAQGSVTATVGSAGTVQGRLRYKPYGSLLSQSGAPEIAHYRWLGQWGYRRTDTASSTNYVRRRHYNSSTGAWISIDPRPEGVNRYEYAKSSPVTFIDPSGTTPIYMKFNSFINGVRRGPWLPEPGTIQCQIGTDPRDFGGNAEYSRLRAQTVIDSCSIGFINSFSGVDIIPGLSHRRCRDYFSTKWIYEESMPLVTIKDTEIWSWKFDCTTYIKVRASAKHPFGFPLKPAIDFNFIIALQAIKPSTVVVTINGSHDQFPDYEFVVSAGGDRRMLYHKYSDWDGPGMRSLNLQVDFWARTTFTNVEVCCPC